MLFGNNRSPKNIEIIQIKRRLYNTSAFLFIKFINRKIELFDYKLYIILLTIVCYSHDIETTAELIAQVQTIGVVS